MPTNIVSKTVGNEMELTIRNHLGRYQVIILMAHLIIWSRGLSELIIASQLAPMKKILVVFFVYDSSDEISAWPTWC